MKLDVYTDPAMLSTLAGQWTDLLAASGHSSIFATPEWAAACWRAFGADKQMLLLTVRDGVDLLGIAPLAVVQEDGRSLVRFLAYQEVTDYQDIIVRSGAEHVVCRQHVMSYLQSQPWDIDFQNIPAASPSAEIVRTLAPALGYAVTSAVQDVCPVITPLPANFDAHLDSLAKKDRHELRRKLRRLTGDSDLETRVTWRQDDLAGAMDDFVRLHRLSSADKDAFMTPVMVGFFNDVARVCQERGWLCLAFLSVLGVRVSTIMAFEYGKVFYLYNSGYDPDHEYLSVGLLLKALAIEYAITAGMTCYDFLQGNERYKYDLGGKDTQVLRVQCTRTKT